MAAQNIEQIKYALLKKYFGHDSFRSGQEQLVDHILQGRDVLGIMPTGAGKSVCYQLPALMLDGVTVVISPLISLMKDQVNSLIQAGIPSAYLNSSLTLEQYETAVLRAKNGAYKIIYVAPERLDTPSFRSFAKAVKISMIAVDEAHCVSQWGQDFRPSYLKIIDFADSLPVRPIISAFTATATDEVKKDIEKMLRLNSPFSITTGFDRKNLYFAVSEPKDKLEETVRLIRSYGNSSGIVYCSTRKNTELVCEHLNDCGIPCTRYHAGLSDEERRKNQDDFLYDRVRVMAATNAFGMGIDKSNVSFVIHFNMPKNLESYYQEAGRAGRDGSEANCVLLFSRQDVRTNRFLIDSSNDNPELDDETLRRLRERDYKRLDSMTRYCTTADCLRQYILRYFGESAGDMCAKCSNCAVGFVTEDVTLASKKILSCVYRLSERNLRMSASVVTEILRGSKSKRILSFRLEELSTYGIMTDTPALKIRAIIDGLCERNYMRKGEFEALILTNKARELLFEGKTLSMTFKKSTAQSKPKAIAKSTGGRFSEDPELFERLKSVRTELAQKAKMPAYIIFSDAALHDMCQKKPTDNDAFLQVSGVGAAKAERYGERFTAEIRDYLEHKKSGDETELMRRSKVINSSSDDSEEDVFDKLVSAQSVTVEEFADKISKNGGEPKIITQTIYDFLLGEGYISQSDFGFTVTPKGGVNGLALSIKRSGEVSETVVELKRTAQRLVLNCVDGLI
ncbi:MAG: DNA helicase RecQ [Oscillospiraceae bacterium]